MKKIILIIMIIITSYDLSAQKLRSSVFGAGKKLTNTNYVVKGSAFQNHAGEISGTGYKMNVGFWNVYKYRFYSTPSITTNSITNNNGNSALSGGYISLTATDPSVTQKGIVWGKSPNPTISANDGKTENGPNPTSGNSLSYNSNMTGLTINTTYFVRAYLTNINGTFYGQQVVFTTLPTLGEWGVIALITMMAGFGGWMVWRRIMT